MTEPLSSALTGTWQLIARTITAGGREVTRTFGVSMALVIRRAWQLLGAVHEKGSRRGRARAGTRRSGGTEQQPFHRRVRAYFGRYVVDDDGGSVTQTLIGSLSPENVGEVLTRRISVDGDELTIRVDTATDDGEPAVMTLRWRRLG